MFGAGLKYKDCSFESYVCYNQKQKEHLEFLLNFCNNWDSNRDKDIIITLFGNTGTGKTHLAISVLRKIQQLCEYNLVYHSPTNNEKYAKAKFVKFFDLFSEIKTTYNKSKCEHTELEIIEIYRKYRMLVIDEFAMNEKESAWAMERLYAIVDGRISNMVPTILTSNMDLKDLSSYLKQHSISLYSRIFSSSNYMLCFDWDDYRINKGES